MRQLGIRDADEAPRRILDLDGHDAYTLLGLTPDAGQDEILPAYRRTMHVAHPDHGGTAQWAQLVNCAFDVLTRYRDEYDQELALRPMTARRAGWQSDPVGFGSGFAAGAGGEPPRVARVGPDGVFRFARADGDTGPIDTGPIDTGPIDTGPIDTGPIDTGPIDDLLDDDTDDGYRADRMPPRDDRRAAAPPRTGDEGPVHADADPVGDIGSTSAADPEPAPVGPGRPRTIRFGPGRALPAGLAVLLVLVVIVLWWSRQDPAGVVTSVAQPWTTSRLSASSVPTLEPPAPSPTTPGLGAGTGSAAAQRPVRGVQAHHCDVRSDGSLWCSGGNRSGQLGDGTVIDRPGPVRVSGPPDRWTAVVVDLFATCGLRADGSLWCWGDNGHGQLGDGTRVARSVPVQVAPGSSWLAVDLDTHACAVRSDHTLWCWGANSHGELANGTTREFPLPQQVGTEDGWAAVTVSPGVTCGVRQNGSQQCWGHG